MSRGALNLCAGLTQMSLLMQMPASNEVNFHMPEHVDYLRRAVLCLEQRMPEA